MCENSAVNYTDGEVVWVKLGSCWWPGEVVGLDKLPPDVLPSMRKPPIAVVKFFQEDAYEYVKNANSIYKYDCSRKTEFIIKGLNLYRTKHGPMEKFPEDIIRAETATQGDIEILSRDEFQEKKKESYAGIFGDTARKTPGSVKKGKGAKGKLAEYPRTPMRKNVEKADYKVHILVQGSKTPSSDNAPLPEVIAPTTNDEPEPENKDVDDNEVKDKERQGNLEKPATLSTPVASSSGILQCHACSFTTTRLNVLILHNKTHSVSFTPYTPSPVRNKPSMKPSSKSTSETPKIPKVRKPRKEKKVAPPPTKKRAAEEQTNNTETKKIKTDEEIKSSLLADWDDGDEESNDDSSVIVMAGSPEVPEAAESPAIPTSADSSIIQVSTELLSPVEKKFNKSPISEKAEASSDSKYEFCEDEDWPLEADGGRKIPRVKNPKRKEDAKSLSLDDDEVAREVAELLNKTTVPELPAAPEPLKIEENFPEPTIVKSPDKEKLPEKSDEKPPETQPTKAIFKTKTFFRSRHSRSQDAIGKYVAEQLNAVERMDIAETDINGSEAVSSPETRDSPPIEHVKVARLAPKIQLKKMKAEAAQLREKDKNNLDYFSDFDLNPFGELVATNASSPVLQPDIVPTSKKHDNLLQDVLYPTQEIKPVNTDLVDQIKSPTDKLKYFGDHTNETINESLDVRSDVTQVQESEKTAVIPDVEKKSQELKRGNDLQGSEKVDPVITVIELAETELIQNPIDNIIQEQDSAKDVQTSEISNMDHESVTNNMNNMKEHINVVTSEEEMHNVIQIPDTNTTVEASNINTMTLESEIQTIIPGPPAAMQEHQINNIRKPNCIGDTEHIPLVKVSKTYEETTEPYMNESTASAVDALLSVSREADRVTRVISDDPPEDLFEDDNKDNNGMSNDVNGFNEIENGVINEKYVDQIIEPGSAVNETYDKKARENITESISNTIVSPKADSVLLNVVEAVPSESDLQIAETLLNLPSTAIQNKTTNDHQADNCIVTLSNETSQNEMAIPPEEIAVIDKNDKSLKEKELIIPHTKSLLITNNENAGLRYETEQEKSENLNAAQSLVQMSESIDHKINIDHNLSNTINNSKPDPGAFHIKQNNGLDGSNKPEQKIEIKACENNNDNTNGKHVILDTSSSKLLKILEEPCTPKFATNKSTIIKQATISGKEKILNFDVAKSSFKGKPDSPKQKIIIRRTTPNRNTIANITDITTPDKIILSRTKNPAQDGSVQTYTIQTSADAPPDNNPIIIPQKVRKITKPPMKLQKIKPQNSLVAPITETKVRNETTTDEAMFDINSMPIVLSEDLLTPESIEKMPIVMSDGNIITHTPNPPKLIKTKQPVENERIAISATTVNKPEVKTLLMNPVTEVSKVTTPNILSKSSKLRGAKPMLVIDKTTGKQKIIMTKPAESTVKEVKQTPTLIQAVSQNTAKAEKFIILPTQSSPRPGRTQKIVIDPQTGKAHVLVTKGADTQQVSSTENKPVSAKLISPSTETSTTTASGTVMIITNAQGAQSRIVLTPEHEKMLFPKKQQPVVSQIKTIAHRISNPSATSKTVITSIAPARAQNVAPIKTQTRIVPKQKSAIITSKGQLIVGGRVATTAQNIAPMPEIRHVPKRIIASEPKKLVQTIQKSSSEPLIFLQQKSGAVMQLTAAQFEHLQRTGQIVQKAPVQHIHENKVIVQKTITVPSNESVGSIVHKPRARKALSESPAPLKRLKQEIAIAPAMASPVPTLSPLSNTSSIVPCISNTVSVSTSSAYSEFENFEELLPSTAIARQHEPIVTPVVTPVVEQQAQVAPPPGPISDGQLIAVPGEHFGGPPGSFYLCMEDNGTFTPIDHRPLVLDNNQLVPMPEPLPVIGTQPERRDILEAALANSDVFHADTTRDEAPDFRDLNANVSVHCRVSETSTILNQAPIMTPVEVPTKVDSETAVPSNLEDGLAVIGITAHTVPTSLELPITVTDPRIAPKMTDPLSSTSPYATTGLLPSPNTEMFVTTEETIVPMGGPISMPLLTDDESVGKSMPILTDEVAERTVSSVDSAVGSPSSIDVRESENEDSSQWTRRLLTPGSDTSEASAEIPLQPAIQLSVNELSRHS